MPRNDERLKKYPSTDKFRVVDTIGIPHPYCITGKHVSFAADHWSGMLTKEAIIAAEKQGAECDICRQRNRRNLGEILSYEQHETALLVEVADTRELKDIPELRDYLLSIKDMCEKDGFAGFAFERAKSPCDTGHELPHDSHPCEKFLPKGS